MTKLTLTEWAAYNLGKMYILEKELKRDGRKLDSILKEMDKKGYGKKRPS